MLRIWQMLTASALSFALIACVSSDNYAPVADVSGYEALPSSGTYRVTARDTLYSIAWRYGSDYRILAKNNNIAAPYAIHVGQIIYLSSNRPVSVAPPVPVVKLKQPTQAASPQPIPQPVINRAEDKEPNYQASNWTWPAHGTLLVLYSAKNKGIDIGGSVGAPVYAALPGKVVYAGDGLRGYGNLIIIKHNSQYLSAYAYNSQLFVRDGQWIKKGQKIAAMGRAPGGKAELHFEIRRAGTPVNPLKLLN